jgi:hypothetical protein
MGTYVASMSAIGCLAAKDLHTALCMRHSDSHGVLKGQWFGGGVNFIASHGIASLWLGWPMALLSMNHNHKAGNANHVWFCSPML